MKCNLSPFRENYDRQTNQQTDIRGQREVTLPIMIVVVGGMGEERWTWSSGGGWGGGRGGYTDTIHFNFILNIIYIVPRARAVANTRIRHSDE